MRFTKNLLAAAVLAVAAVPSVYAQTLPDATYKNYSVTVTASAPKGSAADQMTATAKKITPTANKFTPCIVTPSTPVGTSTTIDYPNIKDQLAFTIKYDAGPTVLADQATQMKNLYLFLTPPSAALVTASYSITRDASGSLITGTNIAISPATATLAAAAYTVKDNNPGGSQTEVLLGGSIPLEGLETGVWNLTAVIADPAVSSTDPTAWKAWDVTSFVVGAPFAGGGPSGTCQ